MSELQVKYTLIKNSQQLYDLRDTPVLRELEVKYTLIKNSQQLYVLRDAPVLRVNYSKIHTYQELSTALRSQGYTCPESELQVKYTLIKNSQQLYDLRDTPVLRVNYR